MVFFSEYKDQDGLSANFITQQGFNKHKGVQDPRLFYSWG